MTLSDFLLLRRAARQPIETTLTPTQWKALLDETLSPLMERELGLAYLGGWLWAGPWQDHRRKLVRVFLVNQSFGTLQWGWGLEFVPHISGKTLAYHRTDKSARQDLWEVSADFIDGASGRGRAADRRRAVTFGAMGASRDALAAEHRRAFEALLPLMRDFYAATAAPEALLARVSHLLGTEEHDSQYYRFTEGVPLVLSAAFLSAALGRQAAGAAFLDQLRFPDEKQVLASLLREKLNEQPRLWGGDRAEEGEDDPIH